MAKVTDKEERLERVREALLRKGINDVQELNPQLPVAEDLQKPDQEEASVLPIDDIPAGFTDEQHAERNKHLPPAPTRQQFLKGFIRAFNIRLLAEDYKPALSPEELNPPPSKPRQRELMAAVIKQASRINLDTYPKSWSEESWETKYHNLMLRSYRAATEIRGSFWGRAIVIFLALTALT